MVCGSCHAIVSRSSHDLLGYTFGLQPGLVQDSGGFCQIVSSQRQINSISPSQGRVLAPRPFFLLSSALPWHLDPRRNASQSLARILFRKLRILFGQSHE